MGRVRRSRQAGITCNSKRGREIHRIPDGAGRNEHVSRRFGGTEGKDGEDLYGAPVSQNPKESGPGVPLNYSLALFQKGLQEAAGANPAPEGIVVIFGSAD